MPANRGKRQHSLACRAWIKSCHGIVAQDAPDFLVIARDFEGSGAHSTNIAEGAELSVTGVYKDCQ